MEREAEHDGYGKACRRIFDMRDDTFRIEDYMEGVAESYIHLAPDERIEHVGKCEILTTHARIAVEHATRVQIVDDRVSTEYNNLCPAKTIILTFSNSLTYSISTR